MQSLFVALYIPAKVPLTAPSWDIPLRVMVSPSPSVLISSFEYARVLRTYIPTARESNLVIGPKTRSIIATNISIHISLRARVAMRCEKKVLSLPPSSSSSSSSRAELLRRRARARLSFFFLFLRSFLAGRYLIRLVMFVAALVFT